MKTETYERDNIRRWILLLLNCFFLIGIKLPLAGGFSITLRNFKFIDRVYVSRTLNQSALGFCVVMFLAFLVIVPFLHILKLVGMMGDKSRNNAGLSVLFSAMEFVGAVGLPATYIVSLCLNARGVYNPMFFFRSLSIGSYVWALLTFFALILSIRLRPTPPVFKSLAGSNVRDVVCPGCGRRNPQDASFCLGCGRKLVDNANTSKWFCPKCGFPNMPASSRCNSCGAYRPKGY